MIVFVGILVSSSIIPLSFAATLTNEIVEPSNNLFGLESHYVVGFTTATAGTIKAITVTFPTGFNIANAKIILSSGIGPGTISVTGQTLNYTVNSAISVPLGRNIIIDFGKIVNNAALSNTVSVTTRDSLNAIIDGPTTSPAFTLTSASSTMLGTNAVTNTKIANGAVTNTKILNNSINGTQITDGTIVNADLSSTAAIMLTKLAVGILPAGIKINSANIVDGSITGDDIAAGTITGNKLSPSIQFIDCTNLVPGANLIGCNLRGAQLNGLDLHGVNLSGADISEVNFYLANLRGANLNGANLNGSALDGANFSLANLGNANLYNSYLVNANLYYANLSGADLVLANLSGANLLYANLSGANFNGASNQPTGNIFCYGTPIHATFTCIG